MTQQATAENTQPEAKAVPAVTPAREVTQVESVRNALHKMIPQFEMVLHGTGIRADRMFRVAMTCIQQTPKLLQCDRTSLFSALMKSAQLGLEPGDALGQAYLIPFNSKKGMQVQFIVGYKGLIDLARRSGEVSNIIAKEVCEKDDFKIEWHKSPPFTHGQSTAPDADRGKVIGFWALANFNGGGYHWDFMTVAEVNAIRDKSSGYRSSLKYAKRGDGGVITEMESPWFNNYIEMGKKTVLRRIAKYLPMSVQRAAAYDEMAEAGKSVKIEGDFTDSIITVEGESEDVTDDAVAKATPAASGAASLDEFAGKKPEESGKPLTKEESAKLDAADAAKESGDTSDAKGAGFRRK